MGRTTCYKFGIFFVLNLLLCFCSYSGDTVRPGLEGIEYSRPSRDELEFLNAVGKPLMSGLDVTEAMEAWFEGRLLETQKKTLSAKKKWKEALSKLNGLQPLPVAPFDKAPQASFTKVADLVMKTHPNVELQVVNWKCGRYSEYGVLMSPRKLQKDARYPLILYCHGAAFGIPIGFMDFLATMVEKGYVVIAPAMRGEPLFQQGFDVHGKQLRCDGEIENLDGEVDDCLSMLSAAWKLPYVRPDEFAMLGHSFGAGVGLLTAARAGAKAKAVVSYDAWLVNPQRYYWDRMRRAARNWDSWEDYCNQPVRAQLLGLIKRSVIFHARKIQCPLLLFMGGAYNGSVFHQSHADFTSRLRQLSKPFEYVLVPNGSHNFVLSQGSDPAVFALKRQDAFLQKHYPPLPPKAASN